MSAKLKIEGKVGFHNYHKLVVTDARNGEQKQEAYAYNLITTLGLQRLTRNFCPVSINVTGACYCYPFGPSGVAATIETHGFGGRIALGSGTGALSSGRTTLFSSYGTYASNTLYDRDRDGEEGWAYYTTVYASSAGAHNGQVITEIGLTPNTTGNISTHALIEDSEGNPLSVTLGEFDILTVYSTVYVQLAPITLANVTWAGGEDNLFLRFIYANGTLCYKSATTTGDWSSPCKSHNIRVGRSSDAPAYGNNDVLTLIATSSDYSASANLTNMTLSISHRFQAVDGNHANGIWEIGWSHESIAESGGIVYTRRHVFRAVMPSVDFWEPFEVVAEEVGTGDNSETVFNLQWSPIVAESETVTVDGTTQVRGTDYTIDNATGIITFDTAPGTGLAILATYTINMIPKDTNHVLDVVAVCTLSDANA